MRRFGSRSYVSMAVLLVAFVASCASEPEVVEAPADVIEPMGWSLPEGLQGSELVIPAGHDMTPAKIALGEQLFFDKRLSDNGEMSCETCHLPEKGWTDGQKFSPKYNGSLNTRNTPSLYGSGYYPELYWDGRAQGLDAQILAAWKGQMGGTPDSIAEHVAAIPGYAEQFQEVFGGPPTPDTIVQGIAAFVRTLHAAPTPWDRHPQDRQSLEGSEVGRGFIVFSEVANCTLCHLPPNFSDGGFHNTGIGMDAESPDPGRAKYLKAAAEKAGTAPPPEAETLFGAFKTPTLRGIALTGPYFHDGRADTLDASVDRMLKGGIANPHLDEKLKPRPLTVQQRRELIAFLTALTPETAHPPIPKLP